MARQLDQHPQLHFDSLSRSGEWAIDYDDANDVLFLRNGAARPATSVDLKSEVWVRVEPTTEEVVGFEIEGFRESFVVKHPELSREHPVSSTVDDGWLEAFFALVRRMQ